MLWTGGKDNRMSEYTHQKWSEQGKGGNQGCGIFGVKLAGGGGTQGMTYCLWATSWHFEMVEEKLEVMPDESMRCKALESNLVNREVENRPSQI